MKKDLLINQRESISEIIDHIREATDSIYICMYIWRDDKIGNLIVEELLKAADRGVKIDIDKDKSAAVFEHVEQQKQSFFHPYNEHLGLFSKIKKWFLLLTYYRDNIQRRQQLMNDKLKRMLAHDNIDISFDKKIYVHSKYFIFDNETMILGGINIGDKSVDGDEENYCDYMIKFEDESLIKHFWKRKNGLKEINHCQDIEFYFNKKEQDIYEIKPKVLELIRKADKCIDIEMAYMGDRDITKEIIKASRRGINITIITSDNSKLQHDLNCHTVCKMVKKGTTRVKPYFSERNIHSKLMFIDKKMLFIGSANFNKYGLKKLSELNVLVKDAEDLCSKWEKWRYEHLKECKLVSEDGLEYSKTIALAESIFS